LKVSNIFRHQLCAFQLSAQLITALAIGICFSMTTVFRSDVLVNALARVADLPTLPVVFLRTIIQAVTTYKSLIPFIANNVLPKLVAKKIWETPQLWDGFVRLAKMIAPASYGSLLQLPKDWVRDVVEKQPALKQGLRGFLAGRPQARGALYEVRELLYKFFEPELMGRRSSATKRSSQCCIDLICCAMRSYYKVFRAFSLHVTPHFCIPHARFCCRQSKELGRIVSPKTGRIRPMTYP